MGNISVETETGSLVPKLHLALSPFVQKYSAAFFEIHSFPFFFFLVQSFYLQGVPLI